MNSWFEVRMMLTQSPYLCAALCGTFALLALEAWLVWSAQQRVMTASRQGPDDAR
ncbi:hypothetical protein QS306_14370 [Paraburkholderia bonniea]|uniref:hypothetical protein n=1 Tax=Paraburkholderia bonniea TaxID=2152891 RepID=UPI001580B785|nr:hypothetical protein [Paraburkholderia bonniea]WJF91956.1 hypothetical protein QS306_14370 [Paraburkholderia bonniea]WJF95275.1 hypothetical protein QS308_14375 [Paraburkholderia bonniea]